MQFIWIDINVCVRLKRRFTFLEMLTFLNDMTSLLLLRKHEFLTFRCYIHTKSLQFSPKQCRLDLKLINHIHFSQTQRINIFLVKPPKNKTSRISLFLPRGSFMSLSRKLRSLSNKSLISLCCEVLQACTAWGLLLADNSGWLQRNKFKNKRQSAGICTTNI